MNSLGAVKRDTRQGGQRQKGRGQCAVFQDGPGPIRRRRSVSGRHRAPAPQNRPHTWKPPAEGRGHPAPLAVARGAPARAPDSRQPVRWRRRPHAPRSTGCICGTRARSTTGTLSTARRRTSSARISRHAIAMLRQLARSTSVWERRIAMIATQHYIRKRDFTDALAIAELLATTITISSTRLSAGCCAKSATATAPAKNASCAGTRGRCRERCCAMRSRSFLNRKLTQNARRDGPAEAGHYD